jgi:hypothetical protein
MQSIARQRSSVQPVATDPVRNGIDRAQVALGCNTARVAAAEFAALLRPHLCCAEADEPEGSSGGTDVDAGDGLSPVQMRAGGRAQSEWRCRPV